MHRQARNTSGNVPHRTLVVDNGAYSIKAGYAPPSDESVVDLGTDCSIIPNCIARSRDRKVWIGAQLSRVRDFGSMQFRRPVEKGYIVNWEGEKAIWENTFFGKDAKVQCEPHETNLILTEAPNALKSLQTNCDQIVFEEFEFASYYRCIGPTLNAYNDLQALFSHPPDSAYSARVPAECLLVIDSGYSHTTVTPIWRGKPIPAAIRRLDIGGKHITNYLKDLISLRHFDLREETYLVNEIKEDVCFVSQDFKNDLERCRKKGGSDWKRSPDQADIVLDYVLPDYTNSFRGRTRPHDATALARAKMGLASAGPKEDVFPLANERFTPAELLFNPSDIGVQEAGLSDVVMQSLRCIPQGLWGGFLANVVVIGGTSSLGGFVERLRAELQPLIPDELPLCLEQPVDPVKYTWLGGARMASSRETLKSVVVTREEYLEHGSNSAWLLKKFAG